jgi:DNA-binding MarR family transcriptional regulator
MAIVRLQSSMRNRPLATPSNLCVATAFRKATRRITHFYDESLAPSGLRVTQFAVLSELNRRAKRPPTLAELAEALVMDRSGLGHSLGPLERDGLVESVVCESDRRRRLVRLTGIGKARYKTAYPLWRNAQIQFARTYGADVSEGLRDRLLTIAEDDRLC